MRPARMPGFEAVVLQTTVGIRVRAGTARSYPKRHVTRDSPPEIPPGAGRRAIGHVRPRRRSPGRPARPDHHRPGNRRSRRRQRDRGGIPLGLRIPEAGPQPAIERSGRARPAPFSRPAPGGIETAFVPSCNPAEAARRAIGHVRPQRRSPGRPDRHAHHRPWEPPQQAPPT